jgi:hypothetical protein
MGDRVLSWISDFAARRGVFDLILDLWLASIGLALIIGILLGRVCN